MRALSDSDWQVMQPLWERSGEGAGAVTAREIHDAVAAETGWAYTTVKTLLDRLVVKGVLAADREGRTTGYRPLVSRGEARRRAARSLVEKAFGGLAGPLVHQLVAAERLSAAERDELRRLLAAQEGEACGTPAVPGGGDELGRDAEAGGTPAVLRGGDEADGEDGR